MHNKPLDIALSDSHEQTHRSHAARTWQVCTGTSTPRTFGETRVIGLRSVQHSYQIQTFTLMFS